VIQDDLEGKKKTPTGGISIRRQWTSLSKPGIVPGPNAVLFTSAGLIQLCTKLAPQSSHKRRGVKIIYFMTYISDSYSQSRKFAEPSSFAESGGLPASLKGRSLGANPAQGLVENSEPGNVHPTSFRESGNPECL
jgi:hypothetical protein